MATPVDLVARGAPGTAQGFLNLFGGDFGFDFCAADPSVEIGERAGADRPPLGHGFFRAAQPCAVGMPAHLRLRS